MVQPLPRRTALVRAFYQRQSVCGSFNLVSHHPTEIFHRHPGGSGFEAGEGRAGEAARSMDTGSAPTFKGRHLPAQRGDMVFPIERPAFGPGIKRIPAPHHAGMSQPVGIQVDRPYSGTAREKRGGSWAGGERGRGSWFVGWRTNPSGVAFEPFSQQIRR